MFKYIKKLTSVVVMFAVIIVFSSSKVYAESAFSMPPNVEKSAEVIGIVNDIATLTGIGLKSRDVDAAMRKVKQAQLMNINTVIAMHHFFPPKDIATLTGIGEIKIELGDVNIDKKPSVAVGNLVVFPQLDVNVNIVNNLVAVGNLVVFPPLDVNNYKIKTENLSSKLDVDVNIDKYKSAVAVGNLVVFPPLYVNNDKIKTENLSSKLDLNVNIDKYRSAVGVGNLVVFPPLYVNNDPYTDANKISPLNVNRMPNLMDFSMRVTHRLPISCKIELLATNGRYYEGVQEADGSWVYSVAGLKKLTMDIEEFRKSADNSSSGNSGSGTSGGCGSECW
jgi:hypothetical protein